MRAHDGTARLASGDDSRMREFRVAGTLFMFSPIVADPTFPVDRWFPGHADGKTPQLTGFRLIPGRTQLSRIMMLAELRHVLGADAQPTRERLTSLVPNANVLRKRTGSARRLRLRHLRELYGLGARLPILRAMIDLWPFESATVSSLVWARCVTHSITSSARSSIVSGTVRPSALAVLRFTIISYFTGSCTGRSPGFSPRRMRST